MRLLSIIVLILISGCASPPPFQPKAGMSFAQVDYLSAENYCFWGCNGPQNKFKSGLVCSEKWDKDEGVFICETNKQYLKKMDEYPLYGQADRQEYKNWQEKYSHSNLPINPSDSYLGYFYFKNNVLLSEQDLKKIEKDKQDIVDRAAYEQNQSRLIAEERSRQEELAYAEQRKKDYAIYKAEAEKRAEQEYWKNLCEEYRYARKQCSLNFHLIDGCVRVQLEGPGRPTFENIRGRCS